MKVDIKISDVSNLNEILSSTKGIIPGTKIEVKQDGIESDNNFLESGVVITLLIDHFEPILVGLVTSWLYDIIKSKAKSLKINGKDVELKKEKIEEEIKIEVENTTE